MSEPITASTASYMDKVSSAIHSVPGISCMASKAAQFGKAMFSILSNAVGRSAQWAISTGEHLYSYPAALATKYPRASKAGLGAIALVGVAYAASRYMSSVKSK
jgi:hypothetical protein